MEFEGAHFFPKENKKMSFSNTKRLLPNGEPTSLSPNRIFPNLSTATTGWCSFFRLQMTTPHPTSPPLLFSSKVVTFLTNCPLTPPHRAQFPDH